METLLRLSLSLSGNDAGKTDPDTLGRRFGDKQVTDTPGVVSSSSSPAAPPVLQHQQQQKPRDPSVSAKYAASINFAPGPDTITATPDEQKAERRPLYPTQIKPTVDQLCSPGTRNYSEVRYIGMYCIYLCTHADVVH
jgi:hypothetical protein